MTNSTGSNNLAGLLGGLMDAVESVVDFAGRNLSDFADRAEDEPENPVTFKLVAELGLADALILDDGSWQVVAVQGDGFDPDIVSVSLENGESYDLLRSSLVRVV